MALEKDVNSFVTVEEADTYFSNRLDVAAWEAAEEELKAKALVTATDMLNQMDWTGVAVSESQALAFPRTGTYYEPTTSTMVELVSTEVPDRISKATFEIAYHLLNNDGLLDNTGMVQSIVVGSIQLTKIGLPPKIPYLATQMIRPLLHNRGSRSWWRAN